MRDCWWSLVVAFTVLAAPAGAQTPRPREIEYSSFATTEVRLPGRYVDSTLMDTPEEGPSRITITYGQPHARGRKIMGGVVPFDRVWRFGANLATVLRTDVDLILGGVSIPMGVYTLFALPSEKGWHLIVNKQVGQWGLNYDASKDLARIPLLSRTLAEPVESFTIYLMPDLPKSMRDLGAFGTLKIVWERTELTVDWEAK